MLMSWSIALGAEVEPRGFQYPSEQDEDGKYYSGYDNQVHEGNSYTSYSVWVRPRLLSLVRFAHTSSGYLPRRMGLADPTRT